MIASICSEPKVLEVMRIVNIFISIIRIVVPILLIFVLMFKLISAITNNDKDSLAKVKKTAITNIVAAVIIFILPTLINLIVKITFPNNDYNNCLNVKSKEDIQLIYIKKAEALVSKVEENLDINDYNNAMLYLKNVKDEKKKEYEERLNIVKNKIDELNKKYSEYAKVNFSNFKWTYYYGGTGPVKKYCSNTLPYAIWAPEDINDLNGVSLPLIVWLHGAGETVDKLDQKYFVSADVFTRIMSSWNKSGLKPIPAIVIAPQSYGTWYWLDRNFKSLIGMIEYARDEYNIDMERISIFGHSMGADDSLRVAYEMSKNYKKDYISTLVLFSASSVLSTPYYTNNKAYKDFFSNKQLFGFSENNNCKGFFNYTGIPLVHISAGHNEVPKVALLKDEDNDGVSDLIYQIYGEDAKIE